MTAPLRAAVVVVFAPAHLVGSRGVCHHPAPALAAGKDASRELPHPVGVGRRAYVLPDGFARSIHPLARYARVGHGDCYPLASRLLRYHDLLTVTSPLRSGLRYLFGLVAPAVEPPDTVALLWVEAQRYLRREKRLDFLVAVWT